MTPPTPDLQLEVADIFERLGIADTRWSGGTVAVPTPLTGETLSRAPRDTADGVEAAIASASDAYPSWAALPAPVRGQVVRRFGERLRADRELIADLITLETGKIRTEALGEVQEMIDICDFAVGLSRQLYGKTITSERPQHRILEAWHPLGVIGVITAFNFPAAVWGWNVAIALVGGNTVVWKPSEQTPLTSIACASQLEDVLAEAGHPHAHHVVLAHRNDAERLLDDPRVRLVSATGSTRMGAAVGPRVQRRFARTILELGGNNAAIVAPSADLDLVARAALFGAVGTAGQRCTTLRRLVVHRSVAEEVLGRLEKAYRALVIGNPWRNDDVQVGPLIDEAAFRSMGAAIEQAESSGGTTVVGGRSVEAHPNSWYVEPAIVEVPVQLDIVREETFAPLLFTLRYEDFDEAIALNNDVPQGLSSSLFTRDLREAERFMGPLGSDCGIANINVGPSGAEIGGAFGGEKATGGGREAGSDAWRAYMRRTTSTVNGSGDLPLAQGVQF